MANIRLIKRRIRSAKNISQITKAMQMVAASKMKKAQERALAGKVYAEKISTLVRELSQRTDAALHPLMGKGNPEGKTLIILVSTNKGLAGGLNTNLFRQLMKWFPKDTQADIVTVGKKGQVVSAHGGWTLVADFSDHTPFTPYVAPISTYAVEGFLSGKYRDVVVVYNTFVSVLSQKPTKATLLPFATFEDVQNSVYDLREFVIEPSAHDLLAHLLPHYLENQLRSAIQEAEASEHSARMMAMKNATDAALDLVDGLTLIYNKARQEKITNEIADIVTARVAVE